jgi:hypothetical protein
VRVVVVSEEVDRRKKSRVVILVIALVVIIVSSFTIWWFILRTTPAGTYSKYNISFNYPEGTEIDEQGILENEPDLNSGVVTCSWGEGAIEYAFAVGWLKVLQFDMDAGFEGSFEGMEEEGVINIVRDEREETILNGNTLYYETFECDESNKHYYGVIAMTNFEELEKVFIFSYIIEYSNPLQGFLDILETFEAE